MNILYEKLNGAHILVAQKVINYKNFLICGQFNELSVSSIKREYNLCGYRGGGSSYFYTKLFWVQQENIRKFMWIVWVKYAV